MPLHSPFWSDGIYDKGQPSEYSHGAGLTPRGLEHAAPDEGGMYGGKCPPINPDDRGKVRYGAPGQQVRP